MRILFMGTGEIGLPVLRWLGSADSGHGHELIGVFTQPDRPVGRGSVMTPPAPKVLAQEFGVPVFQPERLRKPEAVAQVEALEPDVIVVVAYGQILPQSVLDAPRVACLNLHASILPSYRGAAPIQAAILNGDRQSGMTVMYMAAGLDTGDILLTETLDLAPDETGGSLHDRLADIAPPALQRALELLESGQAPRQPQDDASASHVGKLAREDGRIDWSKDAVELERMIRAYHPWPGTHTMVPPTSEGKKPRQLKILPPAKVEPLDRPVDVEPGTILRADKHGILIATGDAGADRALLLQQLQPESKKVMTAAAFLGGRPFGDSPEGNTRLD